MKLQSLILPENVAAEVAKPLQDTVVDYISLASVARQAHWGVMGREFRSFHAYMDELGAELASLIDETAERMLALGELPLGQMDYVAKHTKLEPLPSDFVQKTDLVVALSDRIAAVVKRIRTRITAVENLDPVSADRLIGSAAGLEKTLWMLQAENK